MAYRLAELAERVGGEVREGDPQLAIDGFRSLQTAGERDLSFLEAAAYRGEAESSRAAALVVPEGTGSLGRPLLVVGDPTLARARLIELFYPREDPAAGVHPTAVVGAGCEVAASAHLGPFVVLGDGCRIADRAVLGAHVVVGAGCSIGRRARLYPHVVLYDRTEVGDGTVLHSGVVLGADGFGYASDGARHVKVPQVGRAVIEAEVEIGANSAVDRAVLDETRVGAGTKIDNLVQVGHNVQIGRGCILCGQVGIAGSARLGDSVVMGGQSGAAGHLELGRGARVAGKSAVFSSVPDGGEVAGIPAIGLAAWRRQTAVAARLGDVLRRVRALERRVRRPAGEAAGGEEA